MKLAKALIVITSMAVVLGSSELRSETNWDTVIFEDDFSAGGPDGQPDPQKWIVNVPEEWWWVQGRSFYPSPVYHPGATFPQVVNGSCLLEHHSYNPYDLAQEHWTFLGGQIRTIEQFPATRAYRFEALVRCDDYPSGLVTSFFTYGHDGAKSDEIDFEFVSKRNNEDPDPTGDWVLTNTSNESVQNPAWVWVSGLDLTQWNLFRIYWHPGQRVDWTWIPDPDDPSSEVVLRTETDALYIPDEGMGVYSNVWAADSGWPDAYSTDLEPVSEPHMNEVLTFSLDDVRVSVPEPTSAVVLAIGMLVLGLRRRHGMSTQYLRRQRGSQE